MCEFIIINRLFSVEFVLHKNIDSIFFFSGVISEKKTISQIDFFFYKRLKFGIDSFYDKRKFSRD